MCLDARVSAATIRIGNSIQAWGKAFTQFVSLLMIEWLQRAHLTSVPLENESQVKARDCCGWQGG